MSQNIFADEWRDCLRAHYMYVVRTEDHVTLPTLTVVMHQAGFNDSELAELRVRATLRTEQVSDDFVPDLEVLETAPPPAEPDAPRVIAVPEMPASSVAEARQEQPVEASEELLPTEMTADELLLIDEDVMLVGDAADEEEMSSEAVEPEELPPDPDAPQQLTLF